MATMNNWILLRGLSRESGHWGDFLPQFQQAFAPDRVLALDFPGNGEFFKQRSPTSVIAMMERCRRQLESAQVPPPYSVVALSMGAMVSIAWAQHYPQEVAQQVLINTSLRPFNPFYQRLRPANYLRLLSLLLTDATPRAWEQAIWEMTSRMSPTDTLASWLAIRQQHPVDRLNVLRQLLAAARFTAPTVAPSSAALLLASTQDRLVNVTCSRSVAQRWHLPLKEHPSAGHDLPLDDGWWVIQQIKAWSAALPAPSAALRVLDRNVINLPCV
jgi:pimeloyl-ACP methyl ester carboxylesterase